MSSGAYGEVQMYATLHTRGLAVEKFTMVEIRFVLTLVTFIS